MSWHRDATGLWCPCFQAYQPDHGDGCPAHPCPENTELTARFGGTPPADDCPTPAKRRHRSKAAAARFQRRNHHTDKDRLYPYECPAGDHWHLTHQTPDQQAAISERITRGAAPPIE